MPERTFELALVDDDASIVRIVEHIIAAHLSEFYAVTKFTDSRAARDWLEQHACDVLISDVEMPGIGGSELLRIGKRRNSGMQAVFLTAHSSWDRIAEAIETGVNDYLLKPVDQAGLVRVLRHAHERLLQRQDAEISSNGLDDARQPVPVG
ncbi:MAG TPA: response regulator [Pirellulales bacterium]|nr:response regulator [Pirellulales bacterium]